MNLINTKLNRYIIPPICILLLAGVIFLFSVSISGKEEPIYFAIGVLVIAFLNIALYFLLQLLFRNIIKNDLLSIFACVSGSLLVSGKIFRIMHWPGALFQLYFGFGLLAAALLLSLLIAMNKKKNS